MDLVFQHVIIVQNQEYMIHKTGAASRAQDKTDWRRPC